MYLSINHIRVKAHERDVDRTFRGGSAYVTMHPTIEGAGGA